MEKLNLRTPKPFDYSKETNTILPKICFYCVSEGATEESYFYGIRNNREKLKIPNDVQIEVVEKKAGQETLSHPLQLVNACLYCMGRIDENGKTIPTHKWEENCKWENYDPSIDQVCVIFDRDYRNLETVLEEIFSLCSFHNIRIVLSSPNFELWLLMHFPGIEQYDTDSLFENKKNLHHQLFLDASENKRYLEILVSKKANGYCKGSKIRFDRFFPHIDTAVRQAKLFCEDSRKLPDCLGTSVGLLIEDFRK